MVFQGQCARPRSIIRVLLWFVGSVSLAVWLVFRDDRFDYRVLAVGALLPDIVDVFFGGAWFFHSVTVSVVVMLVVMLSTRGQRARRSRLLALPIGVFLHLVVDGAFSSTEVFWWPFTGWGNPDVPLPSVARGWWNVPLEVIGLVIILVMAKKHELTNPERRQLFVRTGRLIESPAGAGGQKDVGTC